MYGNEAGKSQITQTGVGRQACFDQCRNNEKYKGCKWHEDKNTCVTYTGNIVNYKGGGGE